MVTMVSYIMQARKQRCFRDMIFSWQPSLPLKYTNQSGTTSSTLRCYSTEKWSEASRLYWVT